MLLILELLHVVLIASPGPLQRAALLTPRGEFKYYLSIFQGDEISDDDFICIYDIKLKRNKETLPWSEIKRY